MEPPLTAYDAVRYPSYTHAQTHPDRLAVIGALSGLEPAPATRCRVLELACGNGNNLTPMAWSLPGSQFVGVDLASHPIRQGSEMIKHLGLTNIQLVCADVKSVGATWGQFDYIIAHGLYSWVPQETREQILEICRLALAPHGVAFVSYNAFPGNCLRQMLREMMLFHVRGLDSPKERVTQAMALARFLAEGHPDTDEYQLWMKAEWQTMLKHQEGYVYHDDLAEVNQPFFFTQFMQDATLHKLQFVAEADYFENFDHGLRESTRALLEPLNSNRILREQYMDFLKCRRFRQTLLCHADRALTSKPDPSKLDGWLVSSSAHFVGGPRDLRPGVSQAFQTPKGAHCETNASMGKACLMLLGQICPEPLAFPDMFSGACQILRQNNLAGEIDENARETLRGFFLKLYSAGVVELRATAPPAVWKAGAKPTASPVARYQIEREERVTTVLHATVQVEDEIGRSLLRWMDGTRDKSELVEQLWRLLKSQDSVVTPDRDEAAARRQIQAQLEENLSKLARLGLLVA